MSLGTRKLIVLGFVAGVFVTGNALAIVQWLADRGVVDLAANLRHGYLTGTAITVILAMLVLLVPAKQVASGPSSGGRRPVCDHPLGGRGGYCSECGSRV